MQNLSNDLLNLSNFVGTITATAWSPLDRDLLSRVFFWCLWFPWYTLPFGETTWDTFYCIGCPKSETASCWWQNVIHPTFYLISHRIHGAGIYASIGSILMGSMLPYIKHTWILWVSPPCPMLKSRIELLVRSSANHPLAIGQRLCGEVPCLWIRKARATRRTCWRWSAGALFFGLWWPSVVCLLGWFHPMNLLVW